MWKVNNSRKVSIQTKSMKLTRYKAIDSISLDVIVVDAACWTLGGSAVFMGRNEAIRRVANGFDVGVTDAELSLTWSWMGRAPTAIVACHRHRNKLTICSPHFKVVGISVVHKYFKAQQRALSYRMKEINWQVFPPLMLIELGVRILLGGERGDGRRREVCTTLHKLLQTPSKTS